MTDFAVRKGFSAFAGDDAQANRRAVAAALTGIVFLGFVLRYFLLADTSIVNGDGIFYVWRAQKIMVGDFWSGISAYWSPFYSVLTGLVGAPIRDFELGARIVSITGGTLLIPLTYYLGKLLFDRTTGLIGSLLVAIHAPLIQASTWVMTESLYGFLFLGMIVTGWLALRDNNIWYWALTGLLIGLGYLTKPEALAFLVLFLPFTLVAAAANRQNTRKLLIGFAVMSFVVAACTIPYVIFLHSKVGEWTLSKKASTNTMGGVDESQQLILTNGGRQTVLDQIWGDEYLPKTEDDTRVQMEEGTSPSLVTKLGWAYRLLRRQIDDLLPNLVSGAFILLVAVGLFSSPWTSSEASRNLYIGAFVLATLIGYSFAVTNIRYLLAIVPLLLIWTGFGAIVLARWLSETVGKISLGRISVPNSLAHGIVIVALVALSTPSVIGKLRNQDRPGMPVEEQRAGLWLRSRVAGEQPTVMASHALVAYYAGAKHVFLPDEDLATIVDYAKRREANYIVLSSRRLALNKRGFPEIPPELAADLELVYSSGEDGENKVRIYKVRL